MSIEVAKSNMQEIYLNVLSFNILVRNIMIVKCVQASKMYVAIIRLFAILWPTLDLIRARIYRTRYGVVYHNDSILD